MCPPLSSPSTLLDVTWCLLRYGLVHTPVSPYVALSVPWLSSGACSCVRQSCFDWALCVVSTLSGLVCCSRVFWLVAWSHCLSRSTRFGPCLVCIRRFLGPHLGLQDGIQSCAVAFYLVLWQAVLCLFTYLDLVCLHLHLRLWLSSSRGSAFGALSLCSRLCARVLPHLFVCSPIGFSGFPLAVAEY